MTITEEKLTKKEVQEILQESNEVFTPALTCTGIDILSYSEKLSKFANFIVCKEHSDIVAYIAFYRNDEIGQLYIPLICVLPKYQHKGLATKMFKYLKVKYRLQYRTIALEVLKQNDKAYEFYVKQGFMIAEDRKDKFLMLLEKTKKRKNLTILLAIRKRK